MNTTEALQAGIEYGFLDSSIIADGHFKPTLLVNDPDRGEKPDREVCRKGAFPDWRTEAGHGRVQIP